MGCSTHEPVSSTSHISRWCGAANKDRLQHFRSLPNSGRPVNREVLQRLPRFHVVEYLDLPPTGQEMIMTLHSMKNNRWNSVGGAEVW